MSIKCRRIGLENPRAVLFQVVELAAVQRPREDADDPEHQHGRHRDEEVEDVHVI